jgi:two-component system chemotaxis response regulator CheB
MRNVIVIGASAGGIAAIKELLAGLRAGIDASILVVIHLSRSSNAKAIASVFQKYTSMYCEVAENGMPIERGHLYIAPEDHHLMVEDGFLYINQGAPENRYRPSIDVLFRSTAVAYNNRVIAVILTGMLEDGTSGTIAVKRCGGVAIVQNPDDAQFSSMPTSVVNSLHVDYHSDLADIASVIHQVLDSPLPEPIEVPKEIEIEANITRRMMSDIDVMTSIADRSDFVCPDCGGGLWSVRDEPTHRYRCHTGHVYTEKLLQEIQDERIEESIWVSIRMLEEKVNLMKVMASRNGEATDAPRHKGYSRRVDEINSHITRLKKLLNSFIEK